MFSRSHRAARASWTAGVALLAVAVLAPSAATAHAPAALPGATVATLTAAPAAVPASAPVTAPAGMTQPIYRVTHANGNTLLTPWVSEAKAAVTNLGWSGYEVAFYAATSKVAGSVPVFRLYNPTTHTFLFTASTIERDNAPKYGFRYEKIAFYVPSWDVAGTSKVHRTHKVVGGVWRYRDVIGDANLAALQADGWIRDAAPYRAVAPVPAVPAAQEPTAPVPTPKPEPTQAPKPEPTQAPTGHPGDGDGVFSIVQFNDTQADVWADNQSFVKDRVNWILNNESAQDIRFAVHTGDVVNWWESKTNNAQYARADRWLQPLSDSSIPFAVAVGNHDTLAVADGQGWANADPVTGRSLAAWGLRQTQLINSIFPASDFRNMAGQMEAGKFDNSFHTFTAEGVDFMVLSIELWPRKEAVDWAEKVVRDHPRHNVIVITHAYLWGNGYIQGDNGGYGSTSPQNLYNRIVGRYDNVKMVLSGHTGWTAERTDVTRTGNKVWSVVTNMSPTSYAPLRTFTINVRTGEVTSDIVRTTPGTRGFEKMSTTLTWIK